MCCIYHQYDIYTFSYTVDELAYEIMIPRRVKLSFTRYLYMQVLVCLLCRYQFDNGVLRALKYVQTYSADVVYVYSFDI